METWFTILGWTLSIVAAAGNGSIIFLVCSKRRLLTKTNAFIISLAVADLGVGVSVFPSAFFCEIVKTSHNSYSICKDIHERIRWLFGYASVTSLCCLVLDRYVAIVKPLKYLNFMSRGRVIQMIFVSWAIPVGFVITVFFLPDPIVVFLVCYGIYLRCSLVSLLYHSRCNDGLYKIPMLVLNSAVNPWAYAFFKRDIKKEMIKKLICRKTREKLQNQ